MVVRVLTGSQEKAVLSFRFDRLKHFGLLRSWTPERVERLLEGLVDAGALESKRVTRVIRGRELTYSELHLSSYGRRLGKGQEEHLEMCFPRPKPKKSPLKWRKLSQELPSGDLLHTLKEVRRQLAQAASVPAYVVASNRSLEEMAQTQPTSSAGMLSVHGMGPSRVERYGDSFLEAIRSHAHLG